MYDLTVKTRICTFKPHQLLPEHEVQQYLKDAVAMFGYRFPDDLLDPEFAGSLVESGEYKAVVEDIEIAVWRVD